MGRRPSSCRDCLRFTRRDALVDGLCAQCWEWHSLMAYALVAGVRVQRAGGSPWFRS